MIVGIDASSLRAGGGVTHVVELLGAADPAIHGFRRIVVWGAQALLDRIVDRPWLEKVHQPMLERGLTSRLLWQARYLSRQARSHSCDVMFVPGGFFLGSFRPFVAMHQNLIPFEAAELRRYAWSATGFRLQLLRQAQGRTFQRADCVIFLTNHARMSVERSLARLARHAVIPHGVDRRFKRPPRPQRSLATYSDAHPFLFLYVSIVDLYKHQWHVADAVAMLRDEGLPVSVEFIGPANPAALPRLKETLERLARHREHIRYSGRVAYEDLPQRYEQADAGVFASSCETFGQILAESMAAGLPLACSNRSAMPELLEDGGVYFDPEEPEDIARVLGLLAHDHQLRARLAGTAFERARALSWERCARETFSVLADVARSRRAIHR